MEKRRARLSRQPAGRLRAAPRMVARRSHPVVSLDQLVPLRPRMGDGKFLAGLVRHRSIVSRLHSRFRRRIDDRCAVRRRLGDLRERSRVLNRATPHQAVHRIHFRNPIGCARIFRHCRGRASHPDRIAIVVLKMGLVFSDQRAAKYFHGRLPPRAHGRADDFHVGGRRASQRAARF